MTLSVPGSIAVAVRADQFSTQILFPPASTSVGLNASGTSPTGLPDFGSITAIEFATSRTGFADAKPVASSTTAAAARGDDQSRHEQTEPGATTAAGAMSAVGESDPARPGGDDLIEPHRLVDVLQPVDTEVAKRHPGRQVVRHERASRLREQHLTAVRRRTDPRSPMHADPHIPLSPAFGSPLCNPIRTRTRTCSGHSCDASSRCASIAADTASRADRNAQNNESPCVSTTWPPCAATAARNTPSCSANTLS